MLFHFCEPLPSQAVIPGIKIPIQQGACNKIAVCEHKNGRAKRRISAVFVSGCESGRKRSSAPCPLSRFDRVVLEAAWTPPFSALERRLKGCMAWSEMNFSERRNAYMHKKTKICTFSLFKFDNILHCYMFTVHEIVYYVLKLRACSAIILNN